MKFIKQFFILSLFTNILMLNAEIIRGPIAVGSDIAFGAADTALDIAEAPVDAVTGRERSYYRQRDNNFFPDYGSKDSQIARLQEENRRLRQQSITLRNQ